MERQGSAHHATQTAERRRRYQSNRSTAKESTYLASPFRKAMRAAVLAKQEICARLRVDTFTESLYSCASFPTPFCCVGRMATEAQRRDTRRGGRVLIRVPVRVRGITQDGGRVEETAEAFVVSRYGALLCTSTLLQMSSPLTVTNGFSHEAESFRVVWLGEKQPDGRWEIGIEADNPREDFWGIRFPTKT